MRLPASPSTRWLRLRDGAMWITADGRDDPEALLPEDWWLRPGETLRVPAGSRNAEEPFADARAQLREYFAAERTEFDLPLAPAGSEFQMQVWRALTEIPYGETASYGEIARRIGAPGEARAVGSANGRNPIAVVVPCHRVIGADGSLTGYGGGLERNRFLLELEAGALSLDALAA